MEKFMTINMGAGSNIIIHNMEKSYNLINLINNNNYIGYIFKHTLRLSSTHIDGDIKYLTYELKR